MNNIEGKVILITGASSGIGKATAKLLSEQGAKLVLAARSKEKLQEISEELSQDDNVVKYKQTDVTNIQDVNELAKFAMDTFGRIDVLINNAGIMPVSLLHNKQIDEWNSMIDVNIKGVLNGIYSVITEMRNQNSGHIINVSSIAGHLVTPSSAVYSGTKFAVRAITEGLRMEESAENSNIRATIISPGAINTHLTETITDSDVVGAVSSIYETTIEPDDMARAITFAINEPANVAVNELIVRPTNQEW
ncbi:SDR family oxidoreductase [Staphylococcus equorum]|uniref:SDR family oxidoreductase n=1 Tax=Staphylococcus equorum TaxID=246432 RepID=UPI002980CE0E|nr:SDR family oxidoreductase [Staphylococcus equorum]MDW5471955.1 SDR family oxidoreductase [Staphylococcus equorum]